MSRFAIASAASVFALLVSCGTSGPVGLPYPYQPDDDDGNSDGEGGAKNDDLGSGATGSGTSVTSASTTTSTTSSSSNTSSVTGPTVAATTGTGGGNDDICVPDGDDLACIACAKEACCDAVQTCQGDANCTCWIDCIKQTLGAIEQCIGQCGPPDAAILDLLDCSGDLCDAECGVLGI